MLGLSCSTGDGVQDFLTQYIENPVFINDQNLSANWQFFSQYLNQDMSVLMPNCPMTFSTLPLLQINSSWLNYLNNLPSNNYSFYTGSVLNGDLLYNKIILYEVFGFLFFVINRRDVNNNLLYSNGFIFSLDSFFNKINFASIIVVDLMNGINFLYFADFSNSLGILTNDYNGYEYFQNGAKMNLNIVNNTFLGVRDILPQGRFQKNVGENGLSFSTDSTSINNVTYKYNIDFLYNNQQNKISLFYANNQILLKFTNLQIQLNVSTGTANANINGINVITSNIS